MAFEYFSQLTLVVPLSLLVVYCVYTKLTSKPLIPEHVPWVGRRSEFFSKGRANLRSFTRGRELLDDAYYKVLTVFDVTCQARNLTKRPPSSRSMA